MKIEVKNRWSGAILFSIETENWRLAVEAAVKGGANLRGANLRDANLGGANLRGANLRDANLGDANLRGANLGDADLGGANLRDANLGDANLGGANLGGANLGGANLGDADLGGANLRGANLGDANLGGAKGIDKFPIQILGHKHFMKTTQLGDLRIGCEEHSFDEWREIAEILGSENGYSAFDVEIYKLHIEHIERIAKLLWNKEEKASA